jgi:hypothetical protein
MIPVGNGTQLKLGTVEHNGTIASHNAIDTLDGHVLVRTQLLPEPEMGVTDNYVIKVSDGLKHYEVSILVQAEPDGVLHLGTGELSQ